MKTPSAYPLEARVVLRGLEKKPELNRRTAIVKSHLNKRQRQTVAMLAAAGGETLLSLKPVNLEYERLPVENLSSKDLRQSTTGTRTLVVNSWRW